MFKPETKAKLKKVWIEASPYIVVMGAFAGVMAVSYDKHLTKNSEEYAQLMRARTEDSNRATDAYLEALRLEAEQNIVKH